MPEQKPREIIGSMLNASVAAEAAAELAEYLASVRRRAVAAGKIREWEKPALHVWADGTAVLGIGSLAFGDHNAPLTDAIEATERWLATDEVALCNAVLGLTEDGRIPQAEAAE